METNILCAAAPESYKLVCGNSGTFRPDMLRDMPRSVSLVAPRGSRAAFQVLVSADRDWTLDVSGGWYSQDGERQTVRLRSDAPFPVTARVVDMHTGDDRMLYADALLTDWAVELRGGETRAVFVSLDIPADAAPGSYTANFSLAVCDRLGDETVVPGCGLSATVEVFSYVLPSACDFRFHLDLWQHPSSVARRHETPLWSDGHFAVLDRYAAALADLGQKAVTLIVSDVPWHGQSCPDEQRVRANFFEYSIVPICRGIDGSFRYDFSAMQRYIDLFAAHGISGELSVYGLVNIWNDETAGFSRTAPDYPDSVHLRYLDEADGLYKFMRRAGDIDAYIAALRDYFVTTGQIDRVRVAADEPADVAAYRASLAHLAAIAPEFRFKAAINHSEFVGEFGDEVSDYAPYINSLCSEYDTLMKYRREMPGKRFLWYICCGPNEPNTFLRSRLVEAYSIGILTSYARFDGFLRWSFCLWNDDPRTDARYPSWAAGDTHLVYPSGSGEPLLSLRYMALRRAVEFYELLEAVRARGDEDALQRAFAAVLREQDIRCFASLPFDRLWSTDECDYTAMTRILLQALN